MLNADIEAAKKLSAMKKNEVNIQAEMEMAHLESERDKALIWANAERLNTFVAIPPSHSMSHEQIVTTCSSVSYCAPPADMNPPAVLYVSFYVESGVADLLRTLTCPSGAAVDFTTPAVVT